MPGSSWKGLASGIKRLFTRAPKADWGKIQGIVNPLVSLEKRVGHGAAEFVKQAPIEKVLVPEASFPARYFGKASAGRTVTMEAAGIQEAIPMITAPGAMKAEQLIGKLGEAYKGTAVHEIAESSYAFSSFAKSKHGAKFLKAYGHFSPDVMRAQGLFMQQVGITSKELKLMYKELPGFRWMKQGFKHGRNKAPNAFKAHDAGRWGRETTFASGDFLPGSSWVGTAIKQGVSMEQIAKAAFRMGASPARVSMKKLATGKFITKRIGGKLSRASGGLTEDALADILEDVYKTGKARAVKEEINKYFKVEAGGRKFVRGAPIGRGGFKNVQAVHELGPRGQKFALAEFKDPNLTRNPGDMAGHFSDIANPPSLRSTEALSKFKAPEHLKRQALGLYKRFTGIASPGSGSKYLRDLKAVGMKEAEFEMSMQAIARKTWGSAVPEIIGKTKSGTGFIQEFGGAVLPETHLTSSLRFAQKHMSRAAAHGGTVPIHLDLKNTNIVRKGTKLQLIDWGVSARTPVTSFEADLAQDVIAAQFQRYKLKSTAESGAELTHTQLVSQEVVKKNIKQKMDIMQQEAQSLPFKLNAQRRMSHGVDRTRK